jgi:exosortase/archaeosortase family protein
MDRKFVIRYLLVLGLLFLASQASLVLLQDLKVLTTSAVGIFAEALSIPAAYAGTDIRLYDVPMEVTLECTALHYMTIYAAGVIAYRRHSRSYRLSGLLIGIAAIFFLNIVRIVVLGMIGHYAAGAFEFVHVYLWQGTFALAVLAVWNAWAKRTPALTAFTARIVVPAAAGAAASCAVLLLLMDHYAAILATVVNAVFGLMNHLAGTAISANAEGDMVVYLYPHATIYNDITKEAMNAVILFALAAASARDSLPLTLTKRIFFGMMILFLQHLGYTVAYGILLRFVTDPDLLAVILWVMVGLAMPVPLLAWWAATAHFRDTPAGPDP